MGRVRRAPAEVHQARLFGGAALERPLDNDHSLTTAAPRARRDRVDVCVGAAIDIGGNSVHLLVALVGNGWTEPLRDRSELLGLGDVLDIGAEIPGDARRKVTAALIDFTEMARRSGAECVTIIGTDPMRRASNADVLAAEVVEATGVPIRVVSEREEALLTYVGVTRGVRPAEPLIVVDIGGGSTEIAISGNGEAVRVTSLPIGSARLTNRIVDHDPPTPDELRLLADAAAEATDGLPVPDKPPRAIFVGGTATNVARLGRLTRAVLERDRKTLGTLTAEQVVARFNVRPRRAQQLPAGVALIYALLAHYGLDEAEISEASLREGAIIAAARFGDAWPEHLEELTAVSR